MLNRFSLDLLIQPSAKIWPTFDPGEEQSGILDKGLPNYAGGKRISDISVFKIRISFAWHSGG